MSLTESPVGERPRSQAPALRLLCGQKGNASALPAPLRGQDSPPPMLRLIDGPTRVLLAGADAGRRAALLDELTQSLSANTVFEQADAVCEVLEHAPDSRMAFITGDLEDASAESLMQMLAHRHPGLPVLIMDDPTRDEAECVAPGGALRIQHA